MIHPITMATRIKSVAGLGSMARPKNDFSGPVLCSIILFVSGSVFSLYKCTKDIVLDAKERIEYYHETK